MGVSKIEEDKESALHYLKIARGQIDAIIKMIENDRFCIDISNQIMASQSLLKKAKVKLIKNHLNECVLKSLNEQNKDEKLLEIKQIISKIID